MSKNNGAKNIASFDYIVIGSGSAGAVVATRLTEDPKVTVLLLEAGQENRGIWFRVPLGFGKILGGQGGHLWSWASAPEPALQGRRISIIQGKITGGSSAVNGMVYVRGFPLDYALWRQLGAEGWSYDEVLPYFRKAERFARGADAYHGGDGPLGVEGAGWRNPLADAFLAAGQTIGLPRIDDFAGASVEGLGYHDVTTWRGRRSSTWHEYLAPNRARTNLHIVSGALVQKIEFDGRQATGVVYEQGGTVITAQARAEIIISAGALHSPQLLQRSGVGPAGLLAQHGIPVVHALPGVGENLMDHLQTGRAYSTTSKATINALMRSPVSMLSAGIKYYLGQGGPMTVGAALAGGFASTEPGQEAPDVQIGFSPFLPNPDMTGLEKGSGFLLSTYQLRPESRGHVRINSADPHEEGSVVLNTLSAEKDRKVLLAGLRMLRRIAEAAPMRGLDVKEVTPGLQDEEDSDAALMARIVQAGGSAYHYSGTARMGTDDLAVVDPSLRVRGIDRLRVIDASVMPTVTSGNTNAASIMIGEKGADLVRANRSSI